MTQLDDFLRTVEWMDSPVKVESLRGLSNRNFLVRDGDNAYVVRLASPGAERFGIDRGVELEVLALAEAAGLGPEVLYSKLPEGHLITSPIPGQEIGQTPDRYREPEMLTRITRAVQQVHQLPAISHIFDPIERIRRAVAAAEEHGIDLPDGSHRALERLNEIEAYRGAMASDEIALCHNDLFAGNIMDTDPIRIIDWEFAGMGDIFFDLATLVVACDESAPLGEMHRHVILDAYFDSVTDRHRRRLDDMVFVVRLHVVAWGITHTVLGTPAQGWEGFTFLGFATELLTQLLADL